VNGSRFAVFLTVVLSIWTLMNAYVLWRVGSLPWVAAHVPHRLILISGLLLWLSYPVARYFESRHWDSIGLPLEWVGSTWMGVLFLLVSLLLVADVITMGGWIFRDAAPWIRAGCVSGGLSLGLFAIWQGSRPPVIREYEVHLAGLPRDREGLKLVHLSDLHLGTLLGRSWLEQLVAKVNSLRPDLVVIVGDLIDGNATRVQPLVPALRDLEAPLGVWGVTGNHDFYAGIERSLSVFEQGGVKVLRDQRAEVAPGLALAGVDDVTVHRPRPSFEHALEQALSPKSSGATILLSHTPVGMAKAAQLGAGLMLSGHTHHGQVWPFGYLVERRYGVLGGRYEIGGMPLIVSRGAGTWGPRMRLWHPSEIVLLRLRAA
jgi:predicted MPP superfamily phosphohydrolase